MDIKVETPIETKWNKIKEHISKHKTVYACTTTGIVVAGITSCIMRGVASKQSISCGHAVAAKRGIAVLGKRVVMNNVSYISADRKGPPSWVVRCKETGDIFTSQRAAAIEMNLDYTKLSKHLNGMLEHANGYTFERVCMAA